MFVAQQVARPSGTAGRLRPGPRAPGAALSCRALRVRVNGSVVLDDLWFDVRVGEAFGVVGEHGTGKSALLLAVCGLLRADSGVLLFDGRELDAGKRGEVVEHARGDGVVLPSGTVIDNLRYWARIGGFELADDILAATGLGEYVDLDTDRCPVRVRRAMGLAVALLSRPRLLVIDDMTGGLGREDADWLLDAVGRVGEMGISVLYAGRSADDVRSVCGRVHLLDRGRLTPAT